MKMTWLHSAHGISFDFYYRPKPSQIGQNGWAAAADASHAGQCPVLSLNLELFRSIFWKDDNFLNHDLPVFRVASAEAKN